MYNNRIIYNIYHTPQPSNAQNTKYLPPAQKLEHEHRYHSQPHTSTIHSDNLCGIRYSDWEYWEEEIDEEENRR
jgi:hypothetical protein